MMSPTHHSRLLLGCIVAALVSVATPNRAAAVEDLDEFKEVSYLVFQQRAGYRRPRVETDRLRGTITVQFRRVPRRWRMGLNPQISSPRKRRFFRSLEPIVARGRTTGIRINVGVNAFSARLYEKRNPRRWVLRVGELRFPPFQFGPDSVPTVPYADLVSDDTAGRDEFAAAEFALQQGRITDACAAFTRLRETHEDLRNWVGLREADCLLHSERYGLAESLLQSIVASGQDVGAIHLARLRLEESSGRTLSTAFNRDLYHIDPELHAYMGTVSDESTYREARALFYRQDPVTALELLERLRERRPQSPFFHANELLPILRWRAIRDTVRDSDWLRAAKAYLTVPSLPPTAPDWVDIHLAGAKALRNVGLARRAVRTYLHVLRSEGAVFDEPTIVMQLAEAYFETNDLYRARITLDFLTDRFPAWRQNRAATRLQGRLGLRLNDDKMTGLAAATLPTTQPEVGVNSQEEDANFLVAAGMVSAQEEGLVAGQSTMMAAASPFATMVKRTLTAAAGQCDELLQNLGPLELADAESLLWTGMCLLGEQRFHEASVLMDAAYAYTGPELLTPALEPLLNDLRTMAQWWLDNEERLAQFNNSQRGM